MLFPGGSNFWAGCARRGDTLIERFRTRKTGALLGLLAYQNRSQSREALIEETWPDCELETGRNNLRVALSALRRILEVEPDERGEFVRVWTGRRVRVRPPLVCVWRARCGCSGRWADAWPKVWRTWKNCSIWRTRRPQTATTTVCARGATVAGYLALQSGDYATAEKYLDQAAHCARDEPSVLAWALNLRGTTAQRRGDWKAAIVIFRRAWSFTAMRHRTRARSRSRRWRARWLATAKPRRRALTLSARVLWRTLNDNSGLGWIEEIEGRAALQSGDWAGAGAHLEASLQLHRTTPRFYLGSHDVIFQPTFAVDAGRVGVAAAGRAFSGLRRQPRVQRHHQRRAPSQARTPRFGFLNSFN